MKLARHVRINRLARLCLDMAIFLLGLALCVLHLHSTLGLTLHQHNQKMQVKLAAANLQAQTHSAGQASLQHGQTLDEASLWQDLAAWVNTHQAQQGHCRVGQVELGTYQWFCLGFNVKEPAEPSTHRLNFEPPEGAILAAPQPLITQHNAKTRTKGRFARANRETPTHETEPPPPPKPAFGWVDLPSGRIHFDPKTQRWRVQP